MQISQKNELSVYQDCPTELEVFEKLEGYARNRLKVPIRGDSTGSNVSRKIGSQEAEQLLARSKQM